MKNILTIVSPCDLEDDLMNLINRLATSEYLSQKHSMMNLVPLVYKWFQQKNREIILK
jgi:hypothetical protein